MAVYVSLIENIELVQSDSSPIWFLGLPNGGFLDDGNWSAKYTASDKFGGAVNYVSRVLPLNTGLGPGDTYTANTKFVFQILPEESALFPANKKAAIAVEITNPALNYKSEVARFYVKTLVQGA